MPTSHPYTDATPLHRNLILGSLQLLAWLLCHPAAWRHHLATGYPALKADFCLAELRWTQWRQPALQRLLLHTYLVWPCLVGLVLWLILWQIHIPTSQRVAGVAFGMAVCLATNVVVGLVVAVAGGLVAGVLGGMVAGVTRGITGHIAFGGMVDVAGSFVICVVASVACSVAASVAHQPGISSVVRQFGSVVIGIGLAGLTAAGFLLVSNNGMHWIATGTATGGIAGSVLGLAIWLRTQRWRCGAMFGVMAAGITGVAHSSVIDSTVNGAFNGVAGIVASVVCGALFTLPYALAGRLAGPWSGSVAGALGGGSWLTVVLIGTPWFPFFTHSQGWQLWPYNLAAILIGLTQTWWRPMLCYPAQAAWSTLLYHIDAQRAGRRSTFLAWHAAFWDTLQRLPLPFLDEYLVLAVERDPEAGQAVMAYIAASPQRWAAQAAQVELEARACARCGDIATLSTIYQHLSTGELAGPASALLRSVSRISHDIHAALQQTSTYNQRLVLHAVEERLDVLLRELTRSSDRYAMRFRPIIAQWQQCLATHIQQVTSAAERRQEIDNPYILGVPLTAQQTIFVGRTDISSRIEQFLRDQRRPPLLLCGQRRMGKTSLLNNLGRLLPSTIVPLFIDLQGPAAAASDHAGLLYNIARSMREAARLQRAIDLPMLPRETLATDPFTAFDEWLDAVEHHLAPHTVLLAFDELEALDQALRVGRFDMAAVLGMLRHLMQFRVRFKVLLTASHTPVELQHWASYLINVQVVQVGYLQENEARQLIERPEQDFPLRYTPEALQQILDLTRGHPFLIQLLCSEIITYKNEQAPAVRRLVQTADIAAAVPQALQQGIFFFADIAQNQIDAAGLAVLRYLAAHGPGAVVDPTILRRYCPEASVATLQRLIQRDLIETIAGDYRFQVELIRRWFALS